MAEKAGALIDSAKQRKAIDWQETRRQVRGLQMRIAKAVKEERPGKVKSLQWLITAPEGKVVHIEFSEFDTEARIDKLYFFNGSGTHEKIMAILTALI